MTITTIIGKILCSLGIHKWNKKYGWDIYSSNVIDWTKKCKRCGRVHQWVEAKPNRYGHRNQRGA